MITKWDEVDDHDEDDDPMSLALTLATKGLSIFPLAGAFPVTLRLTSPNCNQPLSK